MRKIDYRIHEDGSFELWGGGIRLSGCYPAVDGTPLRPTLVETAADGVRYTMPGAALHISLRRDGDGRVALACSARGLPGAHEIEPLGSGEIGGAAGVYIQGFGMEGPSGCFRPSEETPPSHGLTALYRDGGALLACAEEHDRYSCVFRTVRTATLSDSRQTLSGGFNLEGTAGDAVTLPTLYLAEAPDLAGGLRACASRIAGQMGARKRMPPAFFWNSWYHAYETMDQAYLEEITEGIRQADIPFRYLVLDAGYTPHLGDWLTPNHRWPGGLRRAARTILDAGCQAGIWIGPFIVGSESALCREHPDWLLKDLDGRNVVQLRSYTEPKIWGNRDGEYYVLDASHPEALAYLETVFRTLRDWGFTFFKTDFMLWNMHDSATVRRHTPGLTSVEILRRVLEVIRGAIGEESYLLGCIAPFMPFLGYADGMRIAGDGGARWAEPFGPINLLRELPCDNYFNHIFWQNDPDAMLLRDFDTFLTEAEVQSLALLQALSGGTVSTSDPVHRLPEERRALLRFLAPHGAHTPELPYLGTERKELVLLHRLAQGNLLLLLNPTEETLPVFCRLSELFGERDWYYYRYGQADGASRGDLFAERLPPHASVLLFVTEAPLAQPPKNLWQW